MASSLILEFQLAIGHDNEAGLETLDAINPPLFWQNQLGLKTQFYPGEGGRVDGNLRKRRVNLPWVRLALNYVNEVEAALLETYAGPVTVNLRRKSSNDWATYNGQLWAIDWGDFEQAEGAFKEVAVEIHALQEIS